MTGVVPAALTDEALERELEHLHETSNDTFLHGSEDALSFHTARTSDLEEEYLRRNPDRVIDARRTRHGSRELSGQDVACLTGSVGLSDVMLARRVTTDAPDLDPQPRARHAWHPIAAHRPAQAAAGRRAGDLRGAGLPRSRDGRHRRTGRRQQAGALPALPRQARALPGAARRARHALWSSESARRSSRRPTTSSGSRRPSRPTSTSSTATARASGWSSRATCATTRAVRERVERMTQECVDAITDTIAHDTGFRAQEAPLLSVGAAGHGGGQRALVAVERGHARQGACHRAARRAGLARHLRRAALTRPSTVLACSGQPPGPVLLG